METRGNKVLVAAAVKSLANALVRKIGKTDAEIKILSCDKIQERLPLETPDCLVLLAQDKGEVDPQQIEKIKSCDEDLPIIVLSPSKDIHEAVNLMKAGVYDYMHFPPDLSRLKISLQNACRLYQLTKRIFLLENQLGTQTRLEGLLGACPAMQAIFQTIHLVAKTNTTVLITGESGTGKELVAKAIHTLSQRAQRRFVDINCGAIPRELLENELFGHERGAYTGADRRYLGCCERADGGTLFLDEISEMDLALQVKLLRFLQERSFMRVGGNEPIPVDVGIVAATNRDLPEFVAKGTFREDLYYRLHVVVIAVPPLRERKEDIPLLAKYFLEKYAHRNEKLFLEFTQDAMEALLQYDWPGNVRELENTIERAVVLYNDTKIKVNYLPPPLHIAKKKGGRSFPQGFEKLGAKKVLPLTLVERYAIEQALQSCTGNVRMAAKRLQIGQATLYRKIKQYGIRA